MLLKYDEFIECLYAYLLILNEHNKVNETYTQEIQKYIELLNQAFDSLKKVNKSLQSINTAYNSFISFLYIYKHTNLEEIYNIPLYKYEKVNNHLYTTLNTNKVFLMPIEYLNDLFDYANNIYFEDYIDKNQYRILCASTTYDNILNWSHHADSFSGVCYEFNLFQFLEYFEKEYSENIVIFGPVNYVKSRTLLLPSSFLNILNGDDYYFINNALLVFNKSNEFDFEKEYRFLFFSNESNIPIDTKIDINLLFEGDLPPDSRNLLDAIVPSLPKKQIYLNKYNYKIGVK